MKKPPNGGDCVFCEALETRGMRVSFRVAVLKKKLVLLLEPALPGGDCALKQPDQCSV